ncbi:MAG TPA: hypothetical protein VMV82_04445 [Candidatus Dormibacteraeota bacterium]|nr:hypothetical protein [Candidatus Dormibacteraeota bacterium]
MRHWIVVAGLCALLAACGGGGGGGGTPGPNPSPPAPAYYQPLAVGDTWTYTCHNTHNPAEQQYAIQNSVLGTTTVGGQTVYEFSIQIPSSPTQSTTVIQLLANDAQRNTSIYGYLVGGTPQTIAPTIIVAANPGPTGTAYDYTGQNASTIDRIFEGIESSNPTPLGTFTVAPYFESSSTHNYGYALGTGIVEEDHGPSFEYDCLVTSIVLH